MSYTFSCQSLLLVLSTVLPGRKFWQWPLAPDYTAAVRRPSSHQTATSHRGNPFSPGIIRKPELYFLWRCQNAEHSVCAAWWDSSKALRTKSSYNLSDKNTNTAFLVENWVHLKTGVFSWSQSFCKRTSISKECLLSFCVWGHKFCKHLTMRVKVWILFNGLIWTNYNCCVNFKVTIINRSWVWRLRDVCCQLLISFDLLAVT